MNLKEKIQEAALEYSKTWNNYQLQIMAKECFTEGAEKTIELISELGGYSEAEYITKLELANLKISQLEEQNQSLTKEVERLNKANIELMKEQHSHWPIGNISQNAFKDMRKEICGFRYGKLITGPNDSIEGHFVDADVAYELFIKSKKGTEK